MSLPAECVTRAPAAATANFLEILGLLLESSPALLGVKDLDGRYVFANRELEHLFRAEPGRIAGRSDGEFMLPAAAFALEELDRAVARLGHPSKSLDRFSFDGRGMDCATVRFPYRDDAGTIIGTGFVAIEVHAPAGTAAADGLSIDSARRTIVELEQAVQDLLQRASTDALTRAWNRSRIEDSGRHEISRLERYGHPVSLVFIDIDHFKRINDTHGHGAGDEVLRGMCDVVRRCLRSTDLLGRWGGEEFLLLLPNNGLTSACLLAERVRAALAAHAFPQAGRVTASFGVAQCMAGESWESLLARADAALYRAKHGGRNRVEVDALGDADEDAAERLDAGFVRLVWRSNYECGNTLIDQQHRGLFEKGNSLLAAAVNGYAKEDVRPLIDDLIASNIAHFQAEEAVMAMAGFPDAAGHAESHQQLIAHALELARLHAVGELGPGELFQFMAYEVIAGHILREDRKYFPYLNKEGMAGAMPACT